MGQKNRTGYKVQVSFTIAYSPRKLASTSTNARTT